MSATSGRPSIKQFAFLSAGGLILLLPTAIAFFSGGFFAEARAWGLIAAWAAFLVVAVTAPQPLPRQRPGQLLLGGLALLALLTVLELGRTPAEAAAVDDQVAAVDYGVADVDDKVAAVDDQIAAVEC